MSKPIILSDTEWNKLCKRFKSLTKKSWDDLDGMKKYALLRNVNVNCDIFSPISDNLKITYPNDIYMINLKTKYILPKSLLVEMKGKVLSNPNEVGGIIEYRPEIKNIHIFDGNHTKIDLDLGTDTQTLYHTHPDTDGGFEPPSILDVISYLANIIKHIGELIMDLNRNIEHPLDDPLVIQNSMVFSKDGVFVYYVSDLLLRDIVKKLVKLFKNGNYSEQFLKFIDEMELGYCRELFPYNKYYYNIEKLNEYLDRLGKLGIIMKYFPYTSQPESYIL